MEFGNCHSPTEQPGPNWQNKLSNRETEISNPSSTVWITDTGVCIWVRHGDTIDIVIIDFPLIVCDLCLSFSIVISLSRSRNTFSFYSSDAFTFLMRPLLPVMKTTSLKVKTSPLHLSPSNFFLSFSRGEMFAHSDLKCRAVNLKLQLGIIA